MDSEGRPGQAVSRRYDDRRVTRGRRSPRVGDHKASHHSRAHDSQDSVLEQPDASSAIRSAATASARNQRLIGHGSHPDIAYRRSILAQSTPPRERHAMHGIPIVPRPRRQFGLTKICCQSKLTVMNAEDIASAIASGDPALGLRASLALHRLAERVEADHVASAREKGWSWQQIGDALGVTRQSVHTKYNKEP